MLKEAGLAVLDLDLEVIGTGAIVGALADGQVDAIVFSMLRTVELRNQGVDVDEIRSDTFLPSTSPWITSSAGTAARPSSSP